MGFDGAGPWAVRRLPVQARERFTGILRYCEGHCAWPEPCSVTRCALVGKPKGGDRALGMAPLMPKVQSKARDSEWILVRRPHGPPGHRHQ
eukprot:2994481-Pyramimonas_sp.AAC.1